VTAAWHPVSNEPRHGASMSVNLEETMRHLTLAAVALSATASTCDPTGGWDDLLDSEDTAGDFYEGPIQIAQIDYTCSEGSPDRWAFEVVNDGWAANIGLDIYETGDGNWPGNPNAVWEESHDLENTDWDEAGTWDAWSISLSDVDRPGDQISSRTTLWDCWYDDGNSLAFMVTMFDDSGRAVDCAIWGNESSDYFNGYRNNDCICFDPDGDCSN
jgi:hypothetical protein